MASEVVGGEEGSQSDTPAPPTHHPPPPLHPADRGASERGSRQSGSSTGGGGSCVHEAVQMDQHPLAGSPPASPALSHLPSPSLQPMPSSGEESGGGRGGVGGDEERTNAQQISLHSNVSNGTTPNGHAKSKCFCWCCCCNCASLRNYNICTQGQNAGGPVGRTGSRSGRKRTSNKTTKDGEFPLGPLELNSSNGGKDPDGGDPSADPFSTGDLEPPTCDEIRAWSDNFDRMMRCPYGRRVFAQFLKCEYSEENILFWLACEDLKTEPDESLVEQRARGIYEDYISILSPREVSLDSRVREIINKNMAEPTRDTFEEAQVQIYTLMARDSYPRFVNSALYRKLAGLPTPSRKGSAA